MAFHPVAEHDPIVASLSGADDRVLLNHWLPPQVGVVPVIRIGRHWVNVLWLLPIGFLLAVIGVALAQAARDLPAVRDFLVRYPGVPPTVRTVSDGFPLWLRMQHFLNLFFMTIRSCGVGRSSARNAPVAESKITIADTTITVARGMSPSSQRSRIPVLPATWQPGLARERLCRGIAITELTDRRAYTRIIQKSGYCFGFAPAATPTLGAYTRISPKPVPTSRVPSTQDDRRGEARRTSETAGRLRGSAHR